MAREIYTYTQALKSAMRYCAYQERCHMEVREKLNTFLISSTEREDIISTLISDDFIDEERFSRSYSRGKFRIKSWGKQKIIAALRQREISQYCIEKGLAEIDEAEYEEVIIQLIKKKRTQFKDLPEYQQMAKTANYIIGRGFESSRVWQTIKR